MSMWKPIVNLAIQTTTYCHYVGRLVHIVFIPGLICVPSDQFVNWTCIVSVWTDKTPLHCSVGLEGQGNLAYAHLTMWEHGAAGDCDVRPVMTDVGPVVTDVGPVVTVMWDQ